VLDKVEYIENGKGEALKAANRAEFFASVQAGLARSQKTLECKYLYDKRGSVLFDQICDLPEYYPTRTETAILKDYQIEIASRLPAGVEIVELGSGASSKTRILLSSLTTPARYVPVDISGDFLLNVAVGLRDDYPGLIIEPVVADFMLPFTLPGKTCEGRLLFFPGSTIGNLLRDEAAEFMQTMRSETKADQFLIGVDLKKDIHVLEAAYDDAAGVTAAFNLNLLRRINREIGATFDLAKFNHSARYNEGQGRVEMHLVSTEAQTVRVGREYFEFASGETIHTENSHKYGLDEFEMLAAGAGWRKQQVWTDDKKQFAVFLLAAD